MKLEERVTAALRAKAEALPPMSTDVSMIRSTARAQSRRRALLSIVGAVAVIVVLLASGITDLGRDPSRGIPVAPVPSPTPSATTDPIDTGSWQTYTSTRYEFQVGRPPDWTAIPSDRKWNFAIDVADWRSPGQEAFTSPGREIRVSAWSAPLARGVHIETTAEIEAWITDYCRASGSSPCTGIHTRAVNMCLERRDCHPAVLVPFEDDVQAFFLNGIYPGDAMIVVAVWRGESDPTLATYGGAQRLLEAFLSTMEVFPAETP